MSFIRNAWPLMYFTTRSTEYVFPADDGKKSYIEDYGSDYKDKATLIELLANFVLRCTQDEDYTWKMVRILAKDYGVEHLLRKKPASWEQISKEMDAFVKRDNVLRDNHGQ
jgi:hypothetical protein